AVLAGGFLMLAGAAPETLSADELLLVRGGEIGVIGAGPGDGYRCDTAPAPNDVACNGCVAFLSEFKMCTDTAVAKSCQIDSAYTCSVASSHSCDGCTYCRKKTGDKCDDCYS